MTARFGVAATPADRYVAGIGFASAASAEEIIALVQACLDELELPPSQLTAIGTHSRKLGSPLLVAVSQHFGVPLHLLDDDDLAGHGVSEAVAAAAGPLRLNKHKSAHATCAIAACGPGFAIERFGQPMVFKAPMASSTLLTSSAGP